jgi:ferredoxin
MSEVPLARVISIDRDLCTGGGVCIAHAPATFAHDHETKSVVVDPEGDRLGDLLAAIEGCPTGAIKFSDQEGA